MADAPPSRVRWPRLLAYGAAGGVFVTLAAGAIVLGPAGPGIARALANNQDVWRLGKLHVDGVEGRGLGDLRVARATLSDEDGVWAVGERLTIAWQPLRLLLGDVALQGAHADKLTVLRQPHLSADKGGGPVTIDAHIAAMSIDRVELAHGVAGAPATFKFAGATITRRGALQALSLDLTRFDRPLDRLKVDYARADTLKLDIDAAGKPGGAFATLIGAPDAAFALHAHASGDSARGGGALTATVGGRDAGHADIGWAPDGWRLAAEARLGAAPAFKALAARFGPLASITASGDAPRPEGAPFQAVLAAGALTGEARGRLNDDLNPVGAVPFSLRANGFAALLPELGLQNGGAQFEGAAEFAEARTRISGRLALDHWRRDGFALSAEGPLEIIAEPKRIAYETDLSGAGVAAPLAELTRLFSAPHYTAKGFYDRAAGAWLFERFAATGPDFDVHGAGRVGAGDTLFKGEWRAPHLGKAIADLSGSVQGQWKLASVKGGQVLDVSGEGARVAGVSPLARLLGGAPKLETKLSFIGALARLDLARLNGRALRMGARGVLSGAPTDLRVEASARGPIDVGGAQISGAIDATGRVTGSLAAPRLYGEAQLGALDVAGARVERAKITLDLTPVKGGAQTGRVGLTGLVSQKPLMADARVSLRGAGLAFDDLNLKVAQLTATGRAAFGPNGPDAQVHLSGAIDGLAPDMVGAVQGELILATAKRGVVNVALDANMAHARFGGRLVADTLSVHATGPMNAMNARFALNGWAGDDPFNLAGDAAGGFGKQGFVVMATAKGALAGAALATRAPAHVRIDGALLEASAALDLGAGKADLVWRGDGARLSAAGAFDHAPLPVLTAMLDQPVAGAITGKIKLSGAKSSLDGDMDFTLTGARLARRSRQSIDATISAQLGGGALRGKMDARSADGLIAHVEGHAPVIAQAAPFRLAAAPGGTGQAHWSLSGPVEGLWALFGPLDQRLAGRVDGAGDAQFGRGGISGSGALTLADGAFEDKQTGVKLQQIAARVDFDPQGMRLASFNATDGRQGRVTGSGRIDGPDNGRLDLTLTNMRLLDRADAKAIGGGAVQVVWKNGGALVTGDVALDEADMRTIGSNAVAAVPVIDVVEINRPGPAPRKRAGGAAIPVSFDLRVHAPGRIFTRTRGLDAEWSLDVRVRGDGANPQLVGAAQLVRGEFNLAGRRFALDTGEMRFLGPLEDAEVTLTATADTPDMTVYVSVSGRALDPQIALTSNPALPEDEILPQLLFGHSSRELSGLEAAQLAASLATLTGKSAFDVAGAARAAVNLDRLEVRQDSGGFLLSGGKYLTRDVYLEVARNALGDASTSVEWQVRPRLYVISSFSQLGDQRVALRWKHDY